MHHMQTPTHSMAVYLLHTRLQLNSCLVAPRAPLHRVQKNALLLHSMHFFLAPISGAFYAPIYAYKIESFCFNFLFMQTCEWMQPYVSSKILQFIVVTNIHANKVALRWLCVTLFCCCFSFFHTSWQSESAEWFHTLFFFFGFQKNATVLNRKVSEKKCISMRAKRHSLENLRAWIKMNIFTHLKEYGAIFHQIIMICMQRDIKMFNSVRAFN